MIRNVIDQWTDAMLFQGTLLPGIGIMLTPWEHRVEVLTGVLITLAKTKKKNARRDAIHTLSSIAGAIILARAVDDPELSEEILREVRAALN